MLTPPPVLPQPSGSLRPPAGDRAGVRPDIQGLRAFAVMVVVLDHLVGWPSGGFIGVDVFFVISGFLITGLLLREYERTGRISFGTFYRRRIKRILPASTVALAVTVLASFLVFGAARSLDIAKDAVAGALFAANWRFATAGTDYFQAGNEVSPLQHFWSLSVEEQFYFVWPAVMLLVLTLVIRRSGNHAQARLGAGIVIGLISLASLGWALWETQALPTRAYFSTFSRAWELGAGATLAIAAPLCTRLGRRIRPVLAWLGLAVMVAGLFLIDAGSPFPGPWAVLPVTGAVLVILAGTGTHRQEHLQPLTNPVSGYLGNISYSLYLWHFPVIILAESVLVQRNALYYSVCAVGMLLLAVYSYHLVENPVRRSSWLSGSRERRREPHPREPREVGREVKLAGMAALVTAVAAAALFSFLPAPSQQISLTSARTVGVPAETAALQEEIREALGDTEWPELEPSMDEAMAGLIAPPDVMDCNGSGPMTVEACTWGDPAAERHAVVVGDSMATTWTDPLRRAFTAKPGWTFTSLGTSGCTFTDPLIKNRNPRIMGACEGRKAEAVEAINALEPDVVFIANTYEARYRDGEEEAMSPQEWQDAMATMVERFDDAAGRIVFLAPPPLFTDIHDCYSRFVTPSYCAGTIEEQWLTFASAERELAAELGSLFVDPTPWFCAEDWCPSYVGGTPVKRDAVHMSPEYQEKIGPALRAELVQQGILEQGILEP